MVLQAVKFNFICNSLPLFVYLVSSLFTFEEWNAAGFSTWRAENKQFPFKARADCVEGSKKIRGTKQRHVTKRRNSEDNASFEETVEVSELCKNRQARVLPDHYFVLKCE